MVENNEDTNMLIKYWGVRGSVPTPITTAQIREKEAKLIKRIAINGGIEGVFGTDKPTEDQINEYLEKMPLSMSGTFGGNTTCVEIQVKDSPLIILDAGTGARTLGKVLMGRLFGKESNFNPLNKVEEFKHQLHVFLSHYHWDHIQGFPFFEPSFVAASTIEFYGKRNASHPLSDVLRGQQQYPNFPVIFDDLPCNQKSHELPRLGGSALNLGQAKITYCELTHPDSVFAYAIEVNGLKFVFASDTEHKDEPDPRLVKLATGAKILYYDAQYDPEGYRGDPKSLTGSVPKVDWGHSTYEWGIKNALAAGVETVVLGHHEPMRDDFNMERLDDRAQEYKEGRLKLLENRGKQLNVIMAYEGLEQRI